MYEKKSILLIAVLLLIGGIFTTACDKKEEKQEPLKSLKLGEKDVAFDVTYQLQPSEGTDPKELTIPDGEYDKELGWVKNISRLGVLKYNEEDGSYSIENFGTGW